MSFEVKSFPKGEIYLTEEPSITQHTSDFVVSYWDDSGEWAIAGRFDSDDLMKRDMSKLSEALHRLRTWINKWA